jgi:hypothetical protein
MSGIWYPFKKLGTSPEDWEDLILTRLNENNEQQQQQVKGQVILKSKTGDETPLSINLGEKSSLVPCFFPVYYLHPDFSFGSQFWQNWGRPHIGVLSLNKKLKRPIFYFSYLFSICNMKPKCWPPSSVYSDLGGVQVSAQSDFLPGHSAKIDWSPSFLFEFITRVAYVAASSFTILSRHRVDAPLKVKLYLKTAGTLHSIHT